MNDISELPNVEEVRSVYSQEDLHEMEGNITFSQEVLNRLEEMTAKISKNEASITRIETDNRYIQGATNETMCSFC